MTEKLQKLNICFKFQDGVCENFKIKRAAHQTAYVMDNTKSPKVYKQKNCVTV